MTSPPVELGAAPGDEYRILRDADLRNYLATLPVVAARLGGSPADWSIGEVGDGNLNLVFIVKGTRSGIAVKKALPYVRLVGESWPLPLSRSHYEYLALVHQARLAPGLVPSVLHHDETLALIAMELLEPHIIMRKGLVSGICYPRFVDHITTFLARTLFLSSDLAGAGRRKEAGDIRVLRQPRAVQDHRGSDLHRALLPGRAEPLDVALARCDRRRLSRRLRPARGDLAAQAQIHGPS
jgi:5-methylthioribose kinase